VSENIIIIIIIIAVLVLVVVVVVAAAAAAAAAALQWPESRNWALKYKWQNKVVNTPPCPLL